MKPTIHTVETLVIGVHVDGQSAAAVGSLRTATGAVEAHVTAHIAPSAWRALAGALADGALIGAAHVLILCDDAAIVSALRRKAAPVGGEQWRVWTGGKGGAYVRGAQGDAAHWATLLMLGWHWAGHWSAQHVAELPGAKALLEQHKHGA